MIASLTYTVVYVVIVGITRVAAVAARWPGSALNGQKRTSTCRRPPLNPSKGSGLARSLRFELSS